MNGAGFITQEQLKPILKNYLLTDGKELIFEILKEYIENLEIRSKEREPEEERITSNEDDIKLDPEMVDKKETIKDFLNELNRYSDEKKVEIKVKQLKQFIIKLFNLNEEIEKQKESVKELKAQEENLKIKIEKYNDEIQSLRTEKEELKNTVDEQKDGIIKLKYDIEDKERARKEIVIENQKYVEEIKMLEKVKKELEERIEIKKRELEDKEKENRALNQKVNKFEEIGVLQKLYEEYLEVSEEYRGKLEKLIKTNDISSFISCCYNIGTMDDLWDFLNIEIRNGNMKDTCCLKNIFQHFILEQNKKYDENLYKLLIPKIGEEFDPIKHMSIDGGNSGTIKEVIFPGYGSMETKSNREETDDKRKFKKIRKLAMVRVK